MADIIDRDELIRGALEAYQRALEKVGNSFKDIVHVVRCKDCKWWSEVPEFAWDGETILTERVCEKRDCYIEPDDFCSWGEKKCGSP